MNKDQRLSTVLLGGILFLGAFLLAYRLSELMMFIGDFGWFYLSARDMLLTGHIPLSGIPSSHPWLHQGPLWTYLLGLSLLIGNFHPLSGAVVTVIFGLFSIFLMYVTGKSMFSEKAGLVAALLFAASPLVIIHARMPYHTAPIPFFTLLVLLGVFQVVRGKAIYLPLVTFSLAVLYNLELATIIYIGAVLSVFIFGWFKKKAYIHALSQKRLLLISFLTGLLPMLPILLYDSTHGFPQTVKFAAWIGYKVLTLFGYPPLHSDIPSDSIGSVLLFFFQHLHKLLFLPSFLFTLMLFIGSLFWLGRKLYLERKSGNYSASVVLLGFFLLVGMGGFFLSKTRSEAYLPMLFPQLLLAVALLFTAGIEKARFRIFTLLVLGLVVYGNISILLHTNYLMDIPIGGYGVTFSDRLAVARQIVKESGKNEYTIVGSGKGSEFPSMTMNYEYLTWWLGKGESATGRERFVIREDPVHVEVRRINNTK